MPSLVEIIRSGQVAEIVLNQPERRNALSVDLFDDLDAALGAAANEDVNCILLRGEGSVFCAGFDLAACVEDATMMGTLIERLSKTVRLLRRLPAPVVASVQGAAIAGGCALLSACDFVVAAADAKLGYPVHRIGVSPAVTLPTLLAAVTPGAARALVMSGELIDGAAAYRIGLATHLAPGADEALADARALVLGLASKPPHAMRTTKAWLNELTGAGDDVAFDATMAASAAAAAAPEAARLLGKAWARR